MVKIPISTDESEEKQQDGVAREQAAPRLDGEYTPTDEAEAAQTDSAGKNGNETAGKPAVSAEGLAALNKEYIGHLQRLQAEFENYKKRVNREKADTIRFATGQLAGKLLSVVDNLQRGLKFSNKNASAEDILEGMRMVERQLLDLLAEHGVKSFDSLGEIFDPNKHQPVYAMETADHEEERIIEEIEQGYMIHDKLLRPAKVVVSRQPAGPEQKSADSDNSA